MWSRFGLSKVDLLLMHLKVRKALKEIESNRETITELGESALKSGKGPAAFQIASQAACLTHLTGIFQSPQECFDAAMKILESGNCYKNLMRWIERLKP